MPTTQVGGPGGTPISKLPPAGPLTGAELVAMDQGTPPTTVSAPLSTMQTSIVGPPGAAGVQGVAGEDGLDGEPGPPGAQGPQGLTGATGQGVPGIPGEDGIDGEPGPPGVAGVQGYTGPQGVPGFALPPEDGADGEIGPPGKDSSSVVQVRGATWSGGNAAIQQNQMTDVAVIIPEDVQITRCTIMTKGGTGSCSVDVQTAPIGSYGTFTTITGGVFPAISSSLTYDNSALAGWTIYIPAGNVLNFHLVSSSFFTEIIINVTMKRTGAPNWAGSYSDAQAVSAVKAAMSNAGNVSFGGGAGVITASTQGATNNNWSQSLGTNGYQIFPSGLIIQWGQFVLPSAGSTSVTFPLTFPNHVWSVVPSQGDSTSYGYPFGADSVTTSGFTATNSTGGILAGTGYYIAIGN